MIVAVATKHPRKMTPEEKARVAMDAIESTQPHTLARSMMLLALDAFPQSLCRLTWKEKRKGKIDRCAIEWKSEMRTAE